MQQLPFRSNAMRTLERNDQNECQTNIQNRDTLVNTISIRKQKPEKLKNTDRFLDPRENISLSDDYRRVRDDNLSVWTKPTILTEPCLPPQSVQILYDIPNASQNNRNGLTRQPWISNTSISTVIPESFINSFQNERQLDQNTNRDNNQTYLSLTSEEKTLHLSPHQALDRRISKRNNCNHAIVADSTNQPVQTNEKQNNQPTNRKHVSFGFSDQSVHSNIFQTTTRPTHTSHLKHSDLKTHPIFPLNQI